MAFKATKLLSGHPDVLDDAGDDVDRRAEERQAHLLRLLTDENASKRAFKSSTLLASPANSIAFTATRPRLGPSINPSLYQPHISHNAIGLSFKAVRKESISGP